MNYNEMLDDANNRIDEPTETLLSIPEGCTFYVKVIDELRKLNERVAAIEKDIPEKNLIDKNELLEEIWRYDVSSREKIANIIERQPIVRRLPYEHK